MVFSLLEPDDVVFIDIYRAVICIKVTRTSKT